MRKVFGMIALLLALAACNKVEMEIQPVEENGGITITATLAPKTAPTKAVADNGDNKITVTWAVDEHIAILYEVSETKYVADAEITAVDGSGAATISFTVESGTADNTPCTLVYPAKLSDGTTTVYKDDLSGVKDAATLLAAQDGTLNTNLDVRVGDGTIGITTPSLDVTTQPEAQFAIFKFTTKNSDASATIDVKPLTVTIDAQAYVITPASATSELYAALPAVSGGKVSFDATDGSDKTYTCAKLDASFDAGFYYQSTLKMREYVNLGNGLKWATMNVGATSPEGYGDYFAWGETETKTDYSWGTYFDKSDGGVSFTKYATDKKTVLELDDDAARAKWGGSWRMPTDAEWTALRNEDNFDWTWTDDYEGTGIAGRVVTSNVSGYKGNTIFLPAAGYRDGSSLYDAGSNGNYWSSSLIEDYSDYARDVYFDSGGVLRDYCDRCIGFSVRPVSE